MGDYGRMTKEEYEAFVAKVNQIVAEAREASAQQKEVERPTYYDAYYNGYSFRYDGGSGCFLQISVCEEKHFDCIHQMHVFVDEVLNKERKYYG